MQTSSARRWPFRQTALLQGPQGAVWLDDLDGIVADLEVRWGITVEQPISGGSMAFVAEARTAEGEDAVLKVAISRDVAAREGRILVAAAGRGYVRLYRRDEACGVLLLERLGLKFPAELHLPVDRQIEEICQALRVAWMPPPEDLGLVSGAQRAGELSEHIQEYWPLLGKPCSGRTFETALKFAQIRADAFEPDTAILAHGDAHALNTLQAPGGGFKLIDPDSLIAERAYDLDLDGGMDRRTPRRGPSRSGARAMCAVSSLRRRRSGVDLAMGHARSYRLWPAAAPQRRYGFGRRLFSGGGRLGCCGLV